MRWVPATFMRGGTSKGLFFRGDVLPAPGPDRDHVFTAALGSPDPFGRQLDGMGGGISSLSKVMVVEASDRPDVQLDYTFGQVDVTRAGVDYSTNCGNLSAAVAAFGLMEGLLQLPDGPATVTMFNTNTGKRVLARLTVVDGQAAVDGDLSIPGVAGTGSPVELVYPDPAGSRTGALLPTGNATDVLEIGDPGGGTFESVPVTLVDAALPMVLVRAADLGVTGTELPEALDNDDELLRRLEALRRAAAVAMGLWDGALEPPRAAPKVALVAPPSATALLDGSTLPAEAADLTVRVISMEKAHKAIPGTGAMCLAAAALVPGTVAAQLIPAGEDAAPAGHLARVERTAQGQGPGGARSVRIATPSGVVVVAAETVERPGAVARASLYRTARPLMRGEVAVP